MVTRSQPNPTPPVCEPQQCLDQALAALPRHAVAAESIFEREPLAKQAAISLSGYLTHCIPFEAPSSPRGTRRVSSPSPSSSLLTRCLSEAIEASASAPHPLVAFLTGLFGAVPRVSDWQVYVARHRAAPYWDFSWGPLSDWIAREGCAPFVVPRFDVVDPSLPDAAVRTVIATRVLSPSHLTRVESAIGAILGAMRVEEPVS